MPLDRRPQVLQQAALRRFRADPRREPRQARLRARVPLRPQRRQRAEQLPHAPHPARGLARVALRRVQRPPARAVLPGRLHRAHRGFRLLRRPAQPRRQAARQPARGAAAHRAAETPHAHARGTHTRVRPVGAHVALPRRVLRARRRGCLPPLLPLNILSGGAFGLVKELRDDRPRPGE